MTRRQKAERPEELADLAIRAFESGDDESGHRALDGIPEACRSRMREMIGELARDAADALTRAARLLRSARRDLREGCLPYAAARLADARSSAAMAADLLGASLDDCRPLVLRELDCGDLDLLSQFASRDPRIGGVDTTDPITDQLADHEAAAAMEDISILDLREAVAHGDVPGHALPAFNGQVIVRPIALVWWARHRRS
ncbi:MAG: hypothetical protein AB7K09_14050 [Planctomycetota bacterium]